MDILPFLLLNQHSIQRLWSYDLTALYKPVIINTASVKNSDDDDDDDDDDDSVKAKSQIVYLFTHSLTYLLT